MTPEEIRALLNRTRLRFKNTPIANWSFTTPDFVLLMDIFIALEVRLSALERELQGKGMAATGTTHSTPQDGTHWRCAKCGEEGIGPTLHNILECRA
jgi:hypothetical protein